MQVSKNLTVQLSVLAVGAFCGIQIAIPCSLVAPSQTAAFSGVVRDRPLLVSERSTPVLVGENGTIPLDPATPDPRVAAAKGGGGDALSFFVPREPLPPGSYTFDGGSVQFSVSSSAADVVPPVGSSGRIQVSIDDDGDGGCFGVSSCGDTSSVQFVVDGPSLDGMYLLEVTTPDGHAFSRFVRPTLSGATENRFLFYGAFREVGRLEVEHCARITGVSPAGTLGPTLDLGCAKTN